MEDCAFGLMRCYLRNDGMIIRSLDTRIFIDFSKDYILREFTVKESSYEDIALKGFKINSEFNNNEAQADVIQQYLTTRLIVRDQISTKKASG